jgi:hypothetical protein
MDRRSFFKFAAMALAGTQAKRVWPFRVYSIPEVVVPAQSFHPTMERIEIISMRAYKVPVKWNGDEPFWLGGSKCFYVPDSEIATYGLFYSQRLRPSDIDIQFESNGPHLLLSQEISLEQAKKMFP